MGFGVEGLGFRVWGLGLRVWGLGFGVKGLGFGVWASGSRVEGLGWCESYVYMELCQNSCPLSGYPMLCRILEAVLYCFGNLPITYWWLGGNKGR